MSLSCNVYSRHTAISCLTNSRLDRNHGVQQVMFDAASAVNDAVVGVVAFSLQISRRSKLNGSCASPNAPLDADSANMLVTVCWQQLVFDGQIMLSHHEEDL